MSYQFLKVSATGLLKVSATGYLIVGGTPPATAIHSIKIFYDREDHGNRDIQNDILR